MNESWHTYVGHTTHGSAMSQHEGVMSRMSKSCHTCIHRCQQRRGHSCTGCCLVVILKSQLATEVSV